MPHFLTQVFEQILLHGQEGTLQNFFLIPHGRGIPHEGLGWQGATLFTLSNVFYVIP